MIHHGFLKNKRVVATIALVCTLSFAAEGCANVTVNTQNNVEEKTEESQEAGKSGPAKFSRSSVRSPERYRRRMQRE